VESIGSLDGRLHFDVLLVAAAEHQLKESLPTSRPASQNTLSHFVWPGSLGMSELFLMLFFPGIHRFNEMTLAAVRINDFDVVQRMKALQNHPFVVEPKLRIGCKRELPDPAQSDDSQISAKIVDALQGSVDRMQPAQFQFMVDSRFQALSMDCHCKSPAFLAAD
jgi:hypothetical protein